eukprot:789490-Amorphochlora_amoeboformis.AAC.1
MFRTVTRRAGNEPNEDTSSSQQRNLFSRTGWLLNTLKYLPAVAAFWAISGWARFNKSSCDFGGN